MTCPHRNLNEKNCMECISESVCKHRMFRRNCFKCKPVWCDLCQKVLFSVFNKYHLKSTVHIRKLNSLFLRNDKLLETL